MQQQSYANHKRYVPGFHFVTGGIALLVLVLAIINLVRVLGTNEPIYAAAIPLLVALAIMMLFWYSRRFAIKAQDRAIRSEENFRHYMLTNKPLDSRLTMGQITALRFAPDEEVVDLAKKAADTNMVPDDIKKEIKNWKADHHRA